MQLSASGNHPITAGQIQAPPMCMKCQQLASQLTTAALSGPSNTVNPVALQANAGSVPAQNITATALSIPSAATNNLNQADITAPTTPSASPAPTQAPSISATKSAPSDPNVSSSNVSASSSQAQPNNCLLYTSPSPRDRTRSRMPSSA